MQFSVNHKKQSVRFLFWPLLVAVFKVGLIAPQKVVPRTYRIFCHPVHKHSIDSSTPWARRTSDFFQILDMVPKNGHAHIEKGRHLGGAGFLSTGVNHSSGADRFFRKGFHGEIVWVGTTGSLLLRLDVVVTEKRGEKGRWLFQNLQSTRRQRKRTWICRQKRAFNSWMGQTQIQVGRQWG